MGPDQETKRAALGYAVALVSSLTRTATYLSLELAQLKRLLSGEEPVPEVVFLKALELLMAAKAAELAAARDAMRDSHLPEITPALERLLDKPKA